MSIIKQASGITKNVPEPVFKYQKHRLSFQSVEKLLKK
jgi:hypothetical protein